MLSRLCVSNAYRAYWSSTLTQKSVRVHIACPARAQRKGAAQDRAVCVRVRWQEKRYREIIDTKVRIDNRRSRQAGSAMKIR